MPPRAIYAGSFDPITIGHLDQIRRAAALFGGLVVAVGCNFRKQTLFDAATRLELVRESVVAIPGVEVTLFDGLLVEFARTRGCDVLVRGIRGPDDYAFEQRTALTNRALAPDIETVWLAARGDTAFVSSTMVREIAHHGGDPTAFVPAPVAERLRRR